MTGTSDAGGPGDRDDVTRAAVAKVVQRMVAARLGKGFVPLGLVFLFGVIQMALKGPLESDYAVLAGGSVVAAGAMLMYGNEAVRRALGNGRTWLARVTRVVGLFPYAFVLYLLGFRGLRPLAGGGADGDAVAVVVAMVFVLLAVRMLWDLSRLTRLHGLARTMTVPAPGERS